MYVYVYIYMYVYIYIYIITKLPTAFDQHPVLDAIGARSCSVGRKKDMANMFKPSR